MTAVGGRTQWADARSHLQRLPWGPGELLCSHLYRSPLRFFPLIALSASNSFVRDFSRVCFLAPVFYHPPSPPPPPPPSLSSLWWLRQHPLHLLLGAREGVMGKWEGGWTHQ